METYITLGDVKSHYKTDINFIKTHPKLFIIMLFTQTKEFRHWEYMWIRVVFGLIKLYILAAIHKFKFWITCFSRGYFPWEI